MVVAERALSPALLAIFAFPHTLEFEAFMSAATLTIENTLRASSVPVSFGYHAYFTIPGADGGGWQIDLPAMRSLALDAKMIPTGSSKPIDYRRFELGGQQLG
jgi:aldose 1-epimerase